MRSARRASALLKNPSRRAPSNYLIPRFVLTNTPEKSGWPYLRSLYPQSSFVRGMAVAFLLTVAALAEYHEAFW